MKNKIRKRLHEIYKWQVYSTTLAPPIINVKCLKSNQLGFIRDYTGSEWSRAFYAPSNPYIWVDYKRVILLDIRSN